MNFNQKYSQIVAIILLIVSIKMYIDHRKLKYQGPYNPAGNYNNISAVKHDMSKAFTVELFVLLVLGLATGEKLYDSNNMLGSWLGKTMVIVTAYFVFHEFVQPYIINVLPNW